MICCRPFVFLCLVALGEVAMADRLDAPPTIDEFIEERFQACNAESAPRVWEFALSGLVEDSSFLRGGVPRALEVLGEPISSVRDETGGWDTDVYMIRRTLIFDGVRIVSFDYIDQGLDVDLKAAEVQEGKAIYEMVVDGPQYSFAFGLRIGSTREQVEEAIALPCWPVAESGRLEVRQLASYLYLASDPDTGVEYTVTFHFDDSEKLSSVVWELQPRH